MPKLNLEALLFCLAWGALAVFAFVRTGTLAGAILSIGLLAVLMPVSSLILDRTGNLAEERLVRWGLLVFAALALAIWQMR